MNIINAQQNGGLNVVPILTQNSTVNYGRNLHMMLSHLQKTAYKPASITVPHFVVELFTAHTYT